MQLPARVFRGDLDASEDLQRRTGGCVLGGAQAGRRVVIGDCNGRQAAATREAHDLRRRVAAVAEGAVNVQVRSAEPSGPAELLPQPRERLTRGHLSRSPVRLPSSMPRAPCGTGRPALFGTPATGSW